MNFSIRHPINFVSPDFHLSGIGETPIELALPYKLEDYLQGRRRLSEVAAYIKDGGVKVLTIHATQGHLTDGGFLDWGGEIMKFAEQLQARSVVFHPENSAKKRRLEVQVIALQNLKTLQRITDVTVAIETFGGPRRVLTPEEIIFNGLPLILDTSHLEQNKTMYLIREHHGGIVGLHLSETRVDEHPEHQGETNQHQPVKDFGFKVLDALILKGWTGTVAL